MKLTDLKQAVNGVLQEHFPDHERYADDVQEGYKRPCFFVQIFPIAFDYETPSYASGRLMLVVNYFSADGTQLENLKMYDALREAFGQSLQVEGRSLRLHNIRSDEADGVLQYKFNLEYLVDLEKDLTGYEVMRELIMDGRGGKSSGSS